MIQWPHPFENQTAGWTFLAAFSAVTLSQLTFKQVGALLTSRPLIFCLPPKCGQRRLWWKKRRIDIFHFVRLDVWGGLERYFRVGLIPTARSFSTRPCSTQTYPHYCYLRKKTRIGLIHTAGGEFPNRAPLLDQTTGLLKPPLITNTHPFQPQPPGWEIGEMGKFEM